ncbi:hypothetical protein [Colwellia sp. UCD-KL20]|uniref:hypothetical protein n=1 Tax=Colwellia sp. UCD-KL20 TaxID=1917165 RepID=UPI000970819A|nr:hypothetical protein [Colwellia sp. UCD-KL20]
MNKPLLSFFRVFMVWVLLLQLLVWWIDESTRLAFFIQSYLAEAAGYLGHFFLDNVSVIDNKLIHADTQRFVIVDHKCTALSLIATLWAAIFALQYRWSLKILMAISACILIQIENIIRIVHLFNEIKYPINQFELYHLYIWQLVNFVSALALFFLMNWLAEKYEARISTDQIKQR